MSDARLHRLVKDGLHALGFHWDKRFVYARGHGPLIEYVAIDRTASAGEFRLSSGVRLAADPFPALALNGPGSGATAVVHAGRRIFRARICCARHGPTIDECASQVVRLTMEHLLPWFDRCRQRDALLSASSPLPAEMRDLLRNGTAGQLAMSRSTADLIGLS